MQARLHLHGIAALIGTALLTFSGFASAQGLTKDQQKCLNAANANAAKIVKAQGKDICSCIKDGAKLKLSGTIEECITSDPKGKVAKAKSKYDSKAGNCDAGFVNLADEEVVKQSAMDKDLKLIHWIFGSDLNVAIVAVEQGDPQTKVDSKCQQAIAKAAKKCQNEKLKAYNKCKKDELKGKNGPEIASADELQNRCLGIGAGSIPDPKSKLAKCKQKMLDTINKKCPNLNVFPGCPSPATALDLNLCIDYMVECEVCQFLNTIDGLNRDCDSFDDGLANGSCSFGEFLALGYNVAGLPDDLSGSIPSLYTPIISPLLNGYDLVLVQESWQTPDPNPLDPLRVYHELLVVDALHPYKSDPAPAPLGLDPNRPSALVSDGLNRFSQFPFDPVIRVAWEGCFGELDNGADCLAQKGFSVARTTLAAGVTLDIYNLHMEAGGGPEDEQVRDDGVTLLTDFLNAFSAGEAVIVGGDFNLHSDEEPDSTQFQRLLSDTGLTDVCDFLACPEPGRIDKFLFRSNDSLTITPKSWNFETDVFVTGDAQPLSDHEALAVRFEWSATPASD